MSESKEPPEIREVQPFKPGKRPSTFRRLNIDFAGTALEQALAEQEKLSPNPMVTPEEVKSSSLPSNDSLSRFNSPSSSDSLPSNDSLSRFNSPSSSDSLPSNNSPAFDTSLPINDSPTLNDSLSRSDNQIKANGGSSISPPQNDSLPSGDSLPRNTRLSPDASIGYRGDRLVSGDSLSNSETPNKNSTVERGTLLALDQVKGHLRLPRYFLDKVYPLLTPFEQVIHLQLYRLSWGFNKPRCLIGLPGLAERSGVGKTAAAKAIKSLESKKLIRKVEIRFGKGMEQGVEYEVWSPVSLSPDDSLPVNDSLPHGDTNIYKEINSVENRKHTHKKAESGKSRFSLEICLQYAEHLNRSGKGVNKPGGYATTIYRSGEADSLIQKYLAEQNSIKRNALERIAKFLHESHIGEVEYSKTDFLEDIKRYSEEKGEWDEEIASQVITKYNKESP
jgi:hypothetical protein